MPHPSRFCLDGDFSYLDGQWEMFDPTGVLYQLGAAYIKVGAYSLKDVLNPDEMVGPRRAYPRPTTLR